MSGLRNSQSSQKRKERVLTKEKASHVTDISNAVVIKDENIFFLTRSDGQVPLDGSHGLGLYYHDCRYLNGYELKIGHRLPFTLGYSAENGFRAELILTNEEYAVGKYKLAKENAAVSWKRIVNQEQLALYDEIDIENLTDQSIAVPITISLRCEFEDIFQVRSLWSETFGCMHERGRRKDRSLLFSYMGADKVFRRLKAWFDPLPSKIQKSQVHFLFKLKTRQSKKLRVSLLIQETYNENSSTPQGQLSPDLEGIRSKKERAYHEWSNRQTGLETDNAALKRIIDRSLHDLHLLRTNIDGRFFFAAGVPWFVTLFGRDTLMSAIQTMAFNPWIGRNTLEILAHYQGNQVNDWSNEEPGKILHELRIGEMAGANKIPYSPFYGSVDSTVLFLLLAAEHLSWTGDLDFFNRMRPCIDAALRWMDDYGDSDRDGYLDYLSSCKGNVLINQGWKDSGKAIIREDGSMPVPPIALAEVQGYAYRVKMMMARIFHKAGDQKVANRLQKEAVSLKRRFNEDYWLPEESVFAMALEKGKRPLKVASSNAGQVLWGDIADDEKAAKMAQRLMAEDMYSGWGIRTLSMKHRSYNPISYHLGSVWPHDTALIAAGFRRYRLDDKALLLASNLIDAAILFKHERLPELFCGYSRWDLTEPVRYPVACHPQSWAAGSIPYMVQVMLGLHPDAFENKLNVIRPMLPPLTEYIYLKGLCVGSSKVDLCFRKKDRVIEPEVIKIDGSLKVEFIQG